MRNASLGTLAVAPYYGIELHPSAFASATVLASVIELRMGATAEPDDVIDVRVESPVTATTSASAISRADAEMPEPRR